MKHTTENHLSMEARYAQLLTHYCLDLQKGDRLLVRTSTLAEPLVREVYRYGLRQGAQVEVQFDFREQTRIFLAEAGDHQLDYVPTLYPRAMAEFEAYLYIMAPHNLRENHDLPAEKNKRRQRVMKPARDDYFRRTATRDLKRNLCLYPTLAHAQEAGLSLEEYQQFVYQACKLFEDDPVASWLAVRTKQQRIVDHLNRCTQIQYKSEDIDISFSTAGRTWINSDGQTNMPSGEVYTSPVEDSVEGHIHFSYPAVYMGHEVEGVSLGVERGEVVRWEADRGKDFLDHIFSLDGTRRFGEAAIGTNYDIDRFTKNILFDEKIGGTVHMAIGQSYQQAGGKNQSSVHWDMIADMRQGSEILADGERIYADGAFLI